MIARGERLLRRAAQRLRLGALGLRIGREAEPGERADMVALDQHVAGRRDLGLQHRILPAGGASARWSADRRNAWSAARAARRTSASSTAFVSSRHVAGSASQSGWLATKVQVRICAMRRGERIDVAFGAVGVADLPGDPIVGHDAAVGDEAEDLADQLRHAAPGAILR